MDWFLFDTELCHERVKGTVQRSRQDTRKQVRSDKKDKIKAPVTR